MKLDFTVLLWTSKYNWVGQKSLAATGSALYGITGCIGRNKGKQWDI